MGDLEVNGSIIFYINHKEIGVHCLTQDNEKLIRSYSIKEKIIILTFQIKVDADVSRLLQPNSYYCLQRNGL